jgi:hypothetical protein
MEKGKFVVPIKSIRTQFMPLVLRWTSSAEAAFVSREHVEAEVSVDPGHTSLSRYRGIRSLSISLSLSLSLSLSPFKLCVFLADSVMCSSRRCASTTGISDGKQFQDNCLILYSDIFISLLLPF